MISSKYSFPSRSSIENFVLCDLLEVVFFDLVESALVDLLEAGAFFALAELDLVLIL